MTGSFTVKGEKRHKFVKFKVGEEWPPRFTKLELQVRSLTMHAQGYNALGVEEVCFKHTEVAFPGCSVSFALESLASSSPPFRLYCRKRQPPCDVAELLLL